MRAPFLLIAVALLAACSDDQPEQQSAAPAPEVAQQAPQQPAPEQADLAASEAAEPAQPAADPCDLSGYDMSKMTVQQHEELVKICERSKQ